MKIVILVAFQRYDFICLIVVIQQADRADMLIGMILDVSEFLCGKVLNFFLILNLFLSELVEFDNSICDIDDPERDCDG